MSTPSSTRVFAEVEQEAYHAWREWALWLVLRQRQLAAALALTQPPAEEPAGQTQPAPQGETPTHD